MADWSLAVWAIPAAYQVAAIAACLAHVRRAHPQPQQWPAISILKPTPEGELPPREAVDSHTTQDYPAVFETLFSEGPPAPGMNAKVGKLIRLGESAAHEVWVINDADIVVESGYLREVASALSGPDVGLVTCLYRARGHSIASSFEAIGVAVDFMPSVLVARLIGIREFGLGATLAFRRSDLDRAGGLESIRDHIADDYQLAKRITSLGLNSELAKSVAQTELAGDWRSVWRHQVRWARTIRYSRPGAYAGLPVAQAALWALFAPGWAAAVLIGLRLTMALVSAAIILRDPKAKRYFWLAPVWDLFAFAVWVAGWTGNLVWWRGRAMRIGPDGTIRADQRLNLG
jgi:ceramide glucosyltransferase